MIGSKSIAITGASGFVGLNLCKFLHSQGMEIVTFVRPITNSKVRAELETISEVFEIGENLIESVNIETFRNIEFIIHLASYAPSEHLSEDLDRLIDSNIRLGLHLANTASLTGSKFLNIGTNWQHFEGNLYNPVSLYAASKQAMQDLVEYFTQAGKLSAIQLDLSDTYGRDDVRDKLIPKLIRHSVSHEPLALSDGNQFIDLVNVYDVVSAIWAIVSNWDDHAERGKYSISSDALITVKELVSTFEKIFECELDKNWGGFSGSSRKMFKSMAIHPRPAGWSPQISLEDGLRELRSPGTRR